MAEALKRVDIPQWLLKLAKEDPFTGCHVALRKQYVPIVCDGEVVGFCNPRQEVFGWRMGPLFVAPGFRRMGLARAWVEGFPYRPMVSFIEYGNDGSTNFHRALGFVEWRRNKFGVFWRLEGR